MGKKMKHIEVFAGVNNQIVLRQESVSERHECESNMILLCPAQIDTVIEWMKEAKAELAKESNDEGRTGGAMCGEKKR